MSSLGLSEITDHVDVVFAVDLRFLVTSGTYSGVPTKEMLAQLVMDQIEAGGIEPIHFNGVSIVEVRAKDHKIAEAL